MTSMTEEDQADLEAFRAASKPAIAISTKQLTTMITAIVTVILGGGGVGYFGMTHEVAGQVEAQVDYTVAEDASENRDEVNAKLTSALAKVDARGAEADADRKEFRDKFTALEKTVDKLAKVVDASNKTTIEMAKDVAVLKDRANR